ncbi:MAG: hypothetical protein ACI35T_02215 [Alistipes sp.]
MDWFIKTQVTTRRLGDGWRKLNVNRCGTHLEGAFKVKHQITVELTHPYLETITIETTEPFADSSDIANFAEQLTLMVDYRRKARRKQKIRDNETLLRTKVLPLWFEREAYIARCSADNEDRRKEARRRLNAGEMELKAYNNLVRSIQRQYPDEDYMDNIRSYNSDINQELDKIDVESDFYLSQHDFIHPFGNNAWEEILQIKHLEGDARKQNIVRIARGVEYFNRLYNLEHQSLDEEQVLAEYDTISVAGFGDIVLAAALKKEGEICAVMAIDNVQGRTALRHLVGAERLGELLPKRAYNAVMRDERFDLDDVYYNEKESLETPIIE